MSNLVAIVGRPNVGKSTLFNRLTQTVLNKVKVYIPSKNEDEIGDTTTKEYITADRGNNVITGGNDMKKVRQLPLQSLRKQ